MVKLVDGLWAAIGGLVAAVLNLGVILTNNAGLVFGIATATQWVVPAIPGFTQRQSQLIIAGAAFLFIGVSLLGLAQRYLRSTETDVSNT
jgi:hypothetical protein